MAIEGLSRSTLVPMAGRAIRRRPTATAPRPVGDGFTRAAPTTRLAPQALLERTQRLAASEVAANQQAIAALKAKEQQPGGLGREERALRQNLGIALRRLEQANASKPVLLEALGHLTLPERQMYDRTLGELERMQVDPDPHGAATYFLATMQHAADLARDDNRLFKDLVAMAFSDRKVDWMAEVPRMIAGGSGAHDAGSALEALDNSIANRHGGSTPRSGFHPAIVDVDGSSTIAHHFAEFLKVGYLNPSLAPTAQAVIDSRSANPGDVRNGLFAAMLGNALREGTIDPDTAVNLTRWALVGKGAPWDKLDRKNAAANEWVRHTAGGRMANAQQWLENNFELADFKASYLAANPAARWGVTGHRDENIALTFVRGSGRSLRRCGAALETLAARGIAAGLAHWVPTGWGGKILGVVEMVSGAVVSGVGSVVHLLGKGLEVVADGVMSTARLVVRVIKKGVEPLR